MGHIPWNGAFRLNVGNVITQRIDEIFPAQVRNVPCASSGAFEIKFVRIKETGPDLLFSERFQWSPGLTQVSLDFWWDEAVLDYWIADVPSCGCPE
jgi:hypothetical protein